MNNSESNPKRKLDIPFQIDFSYEELSGMGKSEIIIHLQNAATLCHIYRDMEFKQRCIAAKLFAEVSQAETKPEAIEEAVNLLDSVTT